MADARIKDLSGFYGGNVNESLQEVTQQEVNAVKKLSKDAEKMKKDYFKIAKIGDKELKDAHTALADTEATYEILKAQLDKYNDLENSITFLSDYSNNRKWKTLDLIGRIIEVKGKATINFGKHKNRPVFDVFQTDPGYYKWMMNGDFPQHTKTVLTELYNQFKNGSTSEKQQKKPKDITSDALEQLKNKFNQR